MKNRYIFVVLAGIIALSALSCAGTPPPEEAPAPPPPPPPAAQPAGDPNLGPPDQAALDALAAAKARAEAARTRAIDFDGPVYAVPDWESAESQYLLAGQEEKTATLGEVKESAALYEAAAGAFDRVFELALPFYAQAREDEIVQARAGAVAAGIADIYPDRLLAADNTVDEAISRYEAKDYYPAASSAFLAVELFNALKTGAEAYAVREEIDDYDFVKYDPENYRLGDDSGGRALDAYDALAAEEALDAAGEALLRYNLVLRRGWETYAGERRALAGTERRAALDLKANVAVKADFDAAAGLYNQGETAFRAERYPEAVDFYFQSEYLFVVVGRTAAEKRRIAEEAIKTAEERTAASEETARNAEMILEGGAE
jgi:HEPN domain-containing protein